MFIGQGLSLDACRAAQAERRAVNATVVAPPAAERPSSSAPPPPAPLVLSPPGGLLTSRGNHRISADDDDVSPPPRSRLGIPIFGSDFWDLHRKWSSESVSDSKDSGWIFFSKFLFLESQKIGIPICDFRNSGNFLHRNSVHLVVTNLYRLQSMYNDLILLVHKLVAQLQR